MNLTRISFALVLALTTQQIFSCALTIINDTNSDVVIVDKDGSLAMHLPAQDATGKALTPPVFGNPNKRAHFRVLVHDASTAEHQFKAQRVAQQIACSLSHQITLKVSDILSGNVDKVLWEVTDYQAPTGTKAEQRMHNNHGATPDHHMALLALEEESPLVVADNWVRAGRYDNDDPRTAIEEDNQQMREVSGNIEHGDGTPDMDLPLGFGKSANQRYGCPNDNCR